MSQNSENIIQAKELVKFVEQHFQSKITWEPLHSISSHSELQTLNSTSDQNIDLLNKRQHDLEQRMHVLETIVGVQNHTEIDSTAREILSSILIIKSVYVRPVQDGLVLFIIHNAKTVSEAIIQIQPKFAELENMFQDVNLKPIILHSDDVQNEHLQQSTVIFTR